MTKKVIKEISVPIGKIANKIYLIREHSIMLDRDLAELYGVGRRNKGSKTGG